MAITTAKKLAAYINEIYFTVRGKNMSPLRLQKTLYFCFAYWGGFVVKGLKYQDDNKKELNIDESQKYLFDDKIEAWVYGPVIPSVYHEEDIKKYLDKELFADNELVKNTVKDIVNDTLDISDFKLVEISHSDKVWQNNFNYDELYHNYEMEKEDIVNEYATK